VSNSSNAGKLNSPLDESTTNLCRRVVDRPLSFGKRGECWSILARGEFMKQRRDFHFSGATAFAGDSSLRGVLEGQASMNRLTIITQPSEVPPLFVKEKGDGR
jgi:hypothetical protein